MTGPIQPVTGFRRTAMTVMSLAAVLLAAVSCVADDPTSASLDQGGESTLPSITTTEAAAATAAAEPATTASSSASSPSSSSSVSTASESVGPLAPLLGLDAELVAQGFHQPIHVTAVPGTDQLVVVEREGLARLVDGTTGDVANQPFLDLTDPAMLLSSSIEQGLLGMVFDPSYEDNGLFYAYWTDADGDSVLARFAVSGPPTANPQLMADPASIEILLTIDQPAQRHNAGHLEFGPDGLLYVAVGDGGSGGGPAQDTTNLLGTILRIDVNPNNTGSLLPDGNPFGSEIWFYGLRNPWRFAVDPVEELMYIGDVGQDSFEEINVVNLDAAGTNFGWREMEGDRCFRSSCDTTGRTVPVLQIEHDQGCSVTGGRVYRGTAIPEFTGHYFFGDWCKGFVRSFRLNGEPIASSVVDQLDHGDDLAEVGQITSFGLDSSGELLTVNWDGQLHRIVPLR